MRIDIEAVNEKKLNYKKVILVIAIFIAMISCVYIGIVLPKLVKQGIENVNEKQNFSEEKEQKESVSMPEMIVATDDKKYPIIDSIGIARINDIYEATYKRVFLTFDDGPSQKITPQILEILDRYDVKATFFTLGSRIELYPEIVKQTYEAGHYIANHGYSHKYSYLYSSIDNIINEYRKTENLIRNAIGKQEYYSNVFRFPGGSTGGKYANIKSRAVNELVKNNIASLDWNCLNRDAEGTFSKEELVQNVINTSQEKNSVVVLMHDAGDKQTTCDALPEIIEYFKNNGYVFETLYDIFDY